MVIYSRKGQRCIRYDNIADSEALSRLQTRHQRIEYRLKKDSLLVKMILGKQRKKEINKLQDLKWQPFPSNILHIAFMTKSMTNPGLESTMSIWCHWFLDLLAYWMFRLLHTGVTFFSFQCVELKSCSKIPFRLMWNFSNLIHWVIHTDGCDSDNIQHKIDRIPWACATFHWSCFLMQVLSSSYLRSQPVRSQGWRSDFLSSSFPC